MKPLPYVISAKAVVDLSIIWHYTFENWPVKQADRYHALIIDEINYTCRNIHSGKSMDHVRKGYRASKVKSHLIFYRVVRDTVEVIRILDESMDVDSQV